MDALLPGLIQNDPALTESNLQWGQYSDSGAQALAVALKVNKTVTMIDLGSNNQIGPFGARALAEALKVDKTVTMIDLRGKSESK